MDWENLTLEDLEALGLSIEDVEAMIAQGGMSTNGYGQYGVLDPIDISSQATQWDVLDAQKTARAATAPPSPTERRLTRNFMFPNPDQFSFDAGLQANPYLRQLLMDAVAVAGPDDPWAAQAYVSGRITDPAAEGYGEGDKGKTRIGKAVTQALPDFTEIARQSHQDDARWATRDPGEQRALLQEWLGSEAENWFAGAAPSASRNTNWADWVNAREMGQTGEPFPNYGGPGFDQGDTTVTTGPSAMAEMSAPDFRRAYQDTLLRDVAGLSAGQQIEDPSGGGYWVISNDREVTPLERAYRAQQTERRRQRRRPTPPPRRRGGPTATVRGPVPSGGPG